MVNFVVFFEQQFYFLDTVASVLILDFADVNSGVGNGVDNGPDAVAAVVACDFLSILGIWSDKNFVKVFYVSSNDSIIVSFDFISLCNNAIFSLRTPV